ncbi:uncharacterized protein LOC111052972 [Nilaparvata lugens]|uniref:uncharacterized protein LOC111052972 n=1 Tax=Nilaparvata lugens TaxID=108931 RepID=UPI00193E50CA|nr:uncharacterized protein LOC111052972 [Nilaparvata lugens]
MRQVLMQRGHYEGESMKLLAKFYLLLTVILIVNTLQNIYYLEADQFEEKVFRFKNINMLICGLAYPLLDRSTYRLISYVEDRSRPSDLTFKPTPSRSQLQQQVNSGLNYVDRITHIVVITIVSTLSVAPLATAILKISRQISSGDQLDVTELSLPISFWYPEKYANLFVYSALSALQMFYVYLFAGYVYCDLTSSFMALKITIYDLKFLCLTVEEWDKKVKDVEGGMKIREDEGGKYVQENKEGNGDDTSLIRSNIVSVIKLHDMICRRSSSMNRDFEMIYTIYNNTICFQICVCLYMSAKMDDLILKAQNILHIIPLAGILFVYCFYSQEILNEGEKFKAKLWESSFVDKPKWYRSSMLIIMIRNAKELEMKPFGVYALNLRTFSVVMKAAYSYFNMLNSLKKRI